MPVPNGLEKEFSPPTVKIVPSMAKTNSTTLTSRKSLLSIADTASVRPPNAGWDNKLEFIFTCISYAVGLGNVWRFPYLCYENGGGAFLIPYVIMLVVVGMPIFFIELSFGQFASLGPLTIWTINPLFKGLGYAMVSVTFVIALYYNVIIAQCLIYFVVSMRSSLPWTTCGNEWNTPNCTVPQHHQATIANVSSNLTDFANLTTTTMLPTTTTPAKVEMGYTPAGHLSIVGTNTEEFFYNYVLNLSPLGINDMDLPQWKMTVSLFVCWAIVALGLIKGIKSLGKISYFTALFPYCMLTVLLVKGLLLPGAMNGIYYYLYPNWKEIMKPQVWQKAANQIFYNLSCATGGLIAMASFNRFKNNCLRDALIVPVLNVFTSIFAGLVVFSVLGYMAYEKGTEVQHVVKSGPGLVFIVYPEALSKLPIAPMWSILFFLMMLTLGFGSELSLVETVLTAFQDDLHDIINTKFRRIAYRIGFCVISFLLGLTMVCRGGNYVLDVLDNYISFIALIVVCLTELIVLAWIYGFPNFRFCDDVSMMLGRRPPMFFQIMWRYVTPVSLAFLLMAGFIWYEPPTMEVGAEIQSFPVWAMCIGWVIALFPILLIPAWILYYIYFLGGVENLGEQLQPMVNWGPASPENRTGRYAAEQNAAMAALLHLQSVRDSKDPVFGIGTPDDGF